MIMQSRFGPDGHSTSQISINMEMPPTTFLGISSGNMNMLAGFLGPSSAAPMFLYAAVPSECSARRREPSSSLCVQVLHQAATGSWLNLLPINLDIYIAVECVIILGLGAVFHTAFELYVTAPGLDTSCRFE